MSIILSGHSNSTLLLEYSLETKFLLNTNFILKTKNKKQRKSKWKKKIIFELQSSNVLWIHLQDLFGIKLKQQQQWKPLNVFIIHVFICVFVIIWLLLSIGYCYHLVMLSFGYVIIWLCYHLVMLSYHFVMLSFGYVNICVIVIIFFFFGLWSHPGDKPTIHSLPCSWIL